MIIRAMKNISYVQLIPILLKWILQKEGTVLPPTPNEDIDDSF